MDLQDKLKIIDREIAKGLKFRAADKLRNLTAYYPDEVILYTKLAELYYASGFLDAAGKYWILTEPYSEHVRKCVEMYEKSVNYSGNQILKDLVFRGDKTKLSLYAQNKLNELEINSKSKVGEVPTYKRKHFNPQNSGVSKITESTLKDKLFKKIFAGCAIVALLLIILIFLIGTVSLWSFLFG